MNQTTRILLLLGVFFAGCAAEQVASRYVVPPARADAPARQQWQYLCWRGTDDITVNANKYGQDGWEMIAGAGTGSGAGLTQHETMVWCFKRPAQ